MIERLIKQLHEVGISDIVVIVGFMKEKYEYCGYQLPNIIFWNVDSRNDIFHADSRRKGVQLYSGQSVTTFQNLLNNIDSTPVKSMEKVIESERYACVRIGNAA